MLKKHIQHRFSSKSLTEASESGQGDSKSSNIKRIAAMRQRELMVVIASRENATDVEWLDEEYGDVSRLRLPLEEPPSMILVTSDDKHLSSPWEEKHFKHI